MEDSARLIELLERLTRETYLILAGLKSEARLAGIRGAYADLFTLERVLRERDLFLAAQDPDERHRGRLRLLERARGLLALETAGLADEILDWEMSQTIRVGGEEVPLQSVPGLLRNTADRGRRNALGQAHLKTQRALLPLLTDSWKSVYGLTAQLGYPVYAAACAEWKDLDLDFLAALAREGLARTAEAYEAGLDKYAERYLGAGYEHVSPFDLPWILRGADWDELFPASLLAETLRATALSFGFDLTQGGNIRLDLELREKKSPRAFCAAVRVPEEIYLVARPAGGHQDFEATLHEAGHAFHFAGTANSLPWEARVLVDDSTAEAYAYLIAGLLRSEEYLVRRIGLPPRHAAAFVDYASFAEVYLFRRYCGKVLYELDLHSVMDLDRSPALYSHRMREALAIDVPGDLGLIEMDTGLYAAQYLLAWLLAGSLEQRLEEELGPAWFEHPAAVERLRALWSCGFSQPWRSLLPPGEVGSLRFEPLLRFLGIRSGEACLG